MTEITPTMLEKPHSRRHFIAGTGAAGLGLVAVACGSSSSKPSASRSASSSATSSATSSAASDLDIAKLAAGLEVLAVGAYKAATEAAVAGKLGVVPPAVGQFITTASLHHQAALDKLNAFIGTPVTAPPADLKATVDAQFAQVTDVIGVAKLALLLEQTAADTYQGAVGSFTSPQAIQLAGSIQVVDQQHAALLLFVLGMYPVPDVFQKGDKAYKPPGTG